jgi:CHAD domain
MKAAKVKRLDPAGSLADNAERIVRTRLDELYGFVPRALDPEEVEHLHDMRIAAKRLRYVLDVTGFCFGPYAKTAAKRAKDLQDLLGEIHDCDVMLPRVLEEAERRRATDVATLAKEAGGAADLDHALASHVAGRSAYRGLGALAVWFEARRDVLHARFLERWEALERQRFRERLERALDQRPYSDA